MKKTLSFILVFVVLLSAIPVFATVASATDENKAAVSIKLSKNTAKVGDTIEATITLGNISTNIVTLPVHFNPAVVKISDMDGLVVADGTKTAEQIRNGNAGTIPGQAISGNPQYWNGAIFVNPNYPSIDNKNGLYRLMFTNTAAKGIQSETLITLRFMAVGAGDADIRFATSADANHDSQSPRGVSYVNADAQLTFVPSSVQALTVASGGSAVTPPPTQKPSGGGGGGYTPTVTVVPPAPVSNTLTYELTESMVEEYLSRAADETANSMNIKINAGGNIDTYIIKIPIAAIRKELSGLVLSTVFETPIGIIGVRNAKTLEHAAEVSQFVTLTLSGSLTCKIDMDGGEISGCILGFPTQNMGSVAFFGGSPIINSKFDGSYLVFDAPQNGSYTIKTTALPFIDVSAGDWAYSYIQSLVAKNILNGTAPDIFAPDANITREQFCKMLVSALGIYDQAADCGFPDIDTNRWYYPYVASAVKAGIIKGYDDGSFGIGKSITRQEMAVMVSRIGVTFPIYTSAVSFTDDDQIGSWASSAVKSVQQANILGGYEDGSFAPQANATRAQSAKIIFGVLTIF